MSSHNHMNTTLLTNSTETEKGFYAPWVAEYGLRFPYGKCQCGCGEDTPISTLTRSNRGWVKGEPKRFLNHHGQRWQQKNTSIAGWVEIYGLQAPYGKCQCGCGNDAPIANRGGALRYGVKRGEPQRFILGHGPKPLSIQGIKYKTLLEAFNSHVQRGQAHECWLATKSYDKTKDYGLVYYRSKKYKAHRVAYQLFVGPIPKGIEVCHRCDNRRCANPNHLFLGTHIDNMNDMVAKGRSANKHTKRKSGAMSHANK